MRDWANLRIELLELIVERLVPNFVDIIRFRSVCKSWGSISQKKPPNPTPQLPWLLLSSDDQTIASSSDYHGAIPTPCCHFFSLSDNKVYSFPLSESFRNCCYRSSHGWLFMVDIDLNCSLLNPLTRVRLVLPSIRSIFPLRRQPENVIVKVAFSSTPNYNANEACLLMVIFRDYGRLALSKLGHNTWIQVIEQRRRGFEDVIYFKGNFYAVDCYGGIVVCDPAVVTTTEIKEQELSKADKTYLVESSGELLLIMRFRGKKVNRSILFKVFREDLISRKWVQVQNLGGHTLFLGYNHSLSLLASEFFSCKGDCIYFTDNCFLDSVFRKTEPHDVGIFNLVDGRIWILPGYNLDSQFITQPPIWVTPSPW